LSIARSLGQLVVAHDDTPAMVDAWADIDTLQSWSMAFAADDAVLMNELGASLEPRWRTLVQAVAAECSQPKADQLPDDVRVLIETGQWTAPRLRTVALTPEAGLLNAYWQGVRLNPRGALAFIAPLLSQHSSPPSPPADLTVSVYRTWLEEWLLTPDAGVAACAPVQTWVFAAARILGSEATWQIARAMALHRAERLVPLLCALAIAPDDELDNTLWAAVDVIDAQPLRVRMLDLILSRWSPDATPVPDPRLVSAAAEVLESEPRHRAALHISGLAAEAGRQWETAVGLWERLARLTNDPGNRAQIYLRMATLLDERLQYSNAALENVIVSFICAPWEPASLAILEMRYRAQRRFRDLASSYTAAAESLVARGNRQQASELLARRAQIELQGIDSPEAAAASLVEAVRLNPSALNLVMLLEQHVAPRAGMHWVERAREAVRSAGPASS
jgi:tetratricopeptide (TPR) repeat protein